MRLDSRFVLWLSIGSMIVVGGIAATADRAASASHSAKGAAKGGDVLADIDGRPLSRADFETAASKADFELRQKYYDAQKDLLNKLILEQLENKEAKARGITVEAL